MIRWTGLLLLAISLALAAGGCGGAKGTSSPGAIPAAARPAGLPSTARAVTEAADWGRIENPLGPKPDTSQARTILSMACKDDVLSIQTDKETVFAKMACSRFLSPRIAESFKGKSAGVRAEMRDAPTILIESTVGSVQFTVDGIWVSGSE